MKTGQRGEEIEQEDDSQWGGWARGRKFEILEETDSFGKGTLS